MASSSGKLVSIPEVSAFIKRCMLAVGTPEAGASLLADVLVTADYRGHFSHGLNRLGWFIILSKWVDGRRWVGYNMGL